MATDASGAEFDPAIHHSKDGAGVLRGDGMWRKRPGGASKPPSESHPDAALLARIAALEGQLADKDNLREARLAAELKATQEELAKLKAPVVPASYAGPAPQLRSYHGLVRAKVDCFVDQYRSAGDIFQIGVQALWTDDPYEPVRSLGYDANGVHQAERDPDAPTPVDFRFRPRAGDGSDLSFKAAEITRHAEALKTLAQ